MTNSPKIESSAGDFENDIHWLAFCYVADELTSEQAVAFERRLADDLETQEALAEVMSMSVSVYDAYVGNDSKSDEDSKVALAARGADSDKVKNWYAVVAVAAGLLVALSVWQSLATNGTGENSSQPELVAGMVSEVELSESWAEILESSSDSDNLSRQVASGGTLVDANDASDDEVSDSVESTKGLLVDPDMVAIFSSAISDIAKGEM